LPKGRPQSAAEASFPLHVLHSSRHLPAAKIGAFIDFRPRRSSKTAFRC
jgi:hypothetical protein